MTRKPTPPNPAVIAVVVFSVSQLADSAPNSGQHDGMPAANANVPPAVQLVPLVHVVCPACALYLPAAQLAHMAWPGCSAYVPAAQGVRVPSPGQ